MTFIHEIIQHVRRKKRNEDDVLGTKNQRTWILVILQMFTASVPYFRGSQLPL